MNSFLQGKKTLAIPPLRAPVPVARPALVSTAPTPKTAVSKKAAPCPGATPTVEAVKEGDKIVRLVVVCTCGERVEIECLYPAGV
jgi:hypothetical protein